MTNAVFDTSFFIDFRRGDSGARAVWAEISSGVKAGSFTPVTAYELWVGQRFSREEEILYESMFAILEDLAITASGAKIAAEWLRGHPNRQELVFRDALIAACASERGHSVLTRNVNDFTQFPGVEVETY